jgi:hypothetical protein
MKIQNFPLPHITCPSILFLGLALPSSALASFYPPGYEIQKSCQTQGPVEVCAINHRYGSFPRLSVKYSGPLSASSWGRVSAYVKLNGREGFFPMQNSDFHEILVVNQPKPYLCFALSPNQPDTPSEPTPHGAYGWCRYTRGEGAGSLVWEVEPLPQQEAQLFFWARNNYGLANAWDVEVAFTSSVTGEWDSQQGSNYRFRFEAM